MSDYNLLFAITNGETCLWCQWTDRSWIAECPEEGECGSLLLRAYRALRSLELPADFAQAKEKAEAVMREIGFTGWYPTSDFSPMPLEELERKAAGYKLSLACRYDLQSKDFTVSTGPDLQHPALAIPGSMDETLAEQAFASAKAIGFALGTKRNTWTRQFREPWKAIAKCLASPDPGKALQAAADGDILSRKAWLETAKQSVQASWDLANETITMLAVKGKAAYSTKVSANLDRKTEVVSIRIAEAFGPGTRPAVLRFLERDGAWYLCLPGGHCYYDTADNVLTNQDLQLKAPYGGREGLAQMLSLLDSRGGADGFRGLRDLAAAIEMAYDVSMDYTSSLGTRFFDWYVLDRYKNHSDAKFILPAEVCSLTWGGLRRWMDKVVSRCSFYRDSERISGAPGEKDGEDLLLLGGDTAGAMSYQQLRDFIQQESRAAVTEPRTSFVDSVMQSETWMKLDGNLAGIGQRIYAVDPLAGMSIVPGVLKCIGGQFCFTYEDGSHEPVQDILDRGGRVSATRNGINSQVAELGREHVWYFRAVEPFLDLSDKAKERVAQQLAPLTVPAGWAYGCAKFRDGRYGIAYGPLREGEQYLKGLERIIQEAKNLPSESALCVLDI